jgi:hypothetical protein
MTQQIMRRRDALYGAGSPRLVLVREPDQLGVAPLRSPLATWLNLGARRPDLVVLFGRGPEMPRSLRRPIEQLLA